MALRLFSAYVLSLLAHFHVVLTARSHEVYASLRAVDSLVIYIMAGTVIVDAWSYLWTRA